MVRFDDLALFVRTAALGSFFSAAREADLLPGQASAAVARLERALDLRLFARSTRSLRLTAEGEQYLPYARQVLELLRDGREHVRGHDSALQGVLQVTAPSDLGRNVLLPWLTEFRAAHPKLTLRMHLSDQVADLYRAPVDVAFRLGRIDDAEHVALPVASDNHRVLVAAPAYLQRHGHPATLMRCASTPACCMCWPGARTTVGNSTWRAADTSCRCAGRCRCGAALGGRRRRHRLQVVAGCVRRRAGRAAGGAVSRMWRPPAAAAGVPAPQAVFAGDPAIARAVCTALPGADGVVPGAGRWDWCGVMR